MNRSSAAFDEPYVPVVKPILKPGSNGGPFGCFDVALEMFTIQPCLRRIIPGSTA